MDRSVPVTIGRHYDHAPITEAVIDIQVELSAEFELSRLEEFQKAVAEQYPAKKKQLHQVQLEWQFAPGKSEPPHGTQAVLGYMLHSADGRQIIQVRKNGFTFSRLTPYETWERMRDEAKRLWDLYRRRVEPTRITRVAVRYINQINIPLPLRDFADYLNISPQLPAGMDQSLSNYLVRLEQPQEDIGAHLVLTTTMVPPTVSDICPVVLDIDVFGQSLDLTDDKMIWELLELLRLRKNAVFEACITDATREMIR
jgi:uncharacterized protein (TIGR04255 family)